MPNFSYTAISPAGKTIGGVEEAASRTALLARLRQRGILPLRVEPASERYSPITLLLHNDLGIGNRISRRDLAKTTRELAVMLTAGQDLDRALQLVNEITGSAIIRKTFSQIREDVRNGAALASALQKHPRSFPPLYIGLIRAGEAGGMLGYTFERLTVMLEKQNALRAKIANSLIYPCLLLATGICCVFFLLTQVLPEFAPVFAQAGVPLPASTQLFMSVARVADEYGLYATFAIGIIASAMHYLSAWPGPKLWLDRALLTSPLIGPLSKEILAAHFTRTFGSLLHSGLPLVSALGMAAGVIGNSAASAAIRATAESAKRGAGLSKPLQDQDVFPLTTIYLLRLGEETSTLAAMALRAADVHEEESDIMITRLTALMVPIITLVIGASVAGIIFSVVSAIFATNRLTEM